jgi:putative membrane protein
LFCLPGKTSLLAPEYENLLSNPNIPMNGIIRFLLSGLAVMLTGYLLPGVSVEHYGYALLVAIVLSLANLIVKPILIILTIPITIVTFGLFLLVINAVIILLVDTLIPTGFEVAGFWWALAFSLILSIFNSLFADLSTKN